MKISFAKSALPTEGAVALPVLEGRTLTTLGRQLDEKSGGALTRAMTNSRFEGKKEQTLVVLAPANLELTRVLLVGIGKADKIDQVAAQSYGGNALAALQSVGDATVTIVVDDIDGSPLFDADKGAQVAFGARLRAFRFDKYRTKEKKEDKPSVKKLVIASPDHGGAKAIFELIEGVAEGVELTRTLASEPANIVYPESFAEEAKKLGELDVEVEVLGEKQMKKLGMGALLGVGQGSARESQLVIMQWKGAGDAAPVAIVGKGVCFDSGGISIKPAAGMEDMKWDMGGAAVTIGLMKALARRKAKVNVIGICGLVENMPSGTAQRPGDVVTSMSGQTIEVINTDAEGRLVLADALWYVQDRFKVKTIVDLATLTGAIIISLGEEYAGLFSNDDKLAEQITKAGEAVGEPVWRLPMGEAYDKLIRSDIADMKNVGERGGGSITAAQFLKRFIQDGVAWAHLDIAGVTWSKKDKPTVPKGATAFGVRLLDRFLAENFEQKK